MKKVLMFAAVTALGIVLATPALAKHRGRDRCRGHSVRVVHGGYHTVAYAPYYRPRPRASFFFGFGVPFLAPAPAYIYAPPPIMLGPGYYEPVWIPGHYVYDRGARVYIAGYWSR